MVSYSAFPVFLRVFLTPSSPAIWLPSSSPTLYALLKLKIPIHLGPLRLVPDHPPTFAGSLPGMVAWVLTHPRNGPLTHSPTFAGSLPGGGLGCLRTRAMVPAHPIHRVLRGCLSDYAGGFTFTNLS
ncbi:hypothetical protein EBX31_08285 [bacterium]|nr:hypothetical protein [bacterium]